LVCFNQDGVRLGGVRILELDGTLVRILDKDASAGAPTWSEDGTAIVYWVQNDATVHGHPGQSLWGVPADGSLAPVRLTEDATMDAVPAISPDQSSIVYVRQTNGRRDGDLYLLKVGVNDRGEVTIQSVDRMQASVTDVDERDPTWSPDGSEIVYSSKGVLMKVAPQVEASPEPLFPRPRPNLVMPSWARR
jgi:Tol biopolymer transport system component